jgi:predicted ATP-grasp superfamily ATP-dependent carboligase
MCDHPRSETLPGRVLVTDGEFKHSLGIARQLAHNGHEVHVTARSARAPSVHSRAVRRWHPVPATSDPAYDDALRKVAEALAPVSVVAVGSGSMAAADRLRGQWASGVKIALPAPDALATANDKARTAVFARGLGLRTPGGRTVRDAADARRAVDELGLPMVLKSSREEGRKAVRYVRDAAGAERAWAEVRADAADAVLAQEYVPGPGWGFSALYWQGRRVRGFVHRRIREWPPSGGTSACAESAPEADAIARAGTTLLDALAWHGVAMVEFKGEPEPGRFALIEINAKFWGSHDVVLAAGVDIPGALVALMEGREVAPQAPYRHIRFAWPFGGDLWHGLFHPPSLPRVLWDAVAPGVAHSFRWDDPLPSLYEIAQWARSTPGAWREHRALR